MDNESKPIGRPKLFTDVVMLQTQIDEYFARCDSHMEEVTEWVYARDAKGTLKKDRHGQNYLVEITHKIMTPPEVYTITGLALHLGTTRRTLLDYEEQDDEFSHTIKMAKTKIEAQVESRLNDNSPAGAIFNLKNNYGWKDKTEVENFNHEMDDYTDEELDEIINEGEKT